MGTLHLTPAKLVQRESVKYMKYDLIILQCEPQPNKFP